MLTTTSPQAHSLPQNTVGSDRNFGDSGDPRRTYLALLPPAQIIDICLSFEPHVPLQVKHSIWPVDLNAAIASLKRSRPQSPVPSSNHPPENGDISIPLTNAPSQQIHPPGGTEEPVVLSLKDVLDSVQASRASSVAPPPSTAIAEPPPTATTEDITQTATPTATSPPQALESTSSPAPATEPSSAPLPAQVQTVQPQNAQASSSTSQPAPQATPQTTTPQTATPHSSEATLAHPHYPYHYPAYGYPGQSPYAQASYYPPPGYMAPYPGYPPYPTQPGYPPLPAHHAHAKMYSSRPVHPTHPPHLHSASPQAGPQSNEDLPSYEEMLVEALMDMADFEGVAPKDIFMWMESRYPLQTNFRPSASQALQKAFRRGRFEKRPNGKYKLNPHWEGGATSKRTTRRPQTLAQTAYALTHPQQPSSPFTHAPLARNSAPAATPPPPASTTATPPSTSHTTPYSGYYGHPSTSQLGYPAPAYGAPPSALQAVSTTAPTSGATSTGVKASNGTTADSGENGSTSPDTSEGVGEGSDAWEAAQHILQAINFGLQLPSTAAGSSNPPPLISASIGFDFSTLAESSASAANGDAMRAVLTNEERATLQAQLALLAAQLAEIAELEDEDEDEQIVPVPPQVQVPTPLPAPPVSLPRLGHVPPPIMASSRPHTGFFIDVNQFPDSSRHSSDTAPPLQPHPDPPASTAPAQEMEEDESDDDDMEMVEVPTMNMMDALRT